MLWYENFLLIRRIAGNQPFFNRTYFLYGITFSALCFLGWYLLQKRAVDA